MIDMFFFNDTATTEIYTLSLHDALPICGDDDARRSRSTVTGRPIHPERRLQGLGSNKRRPTRRGAAIQGTRGGRSEEHTSELQSRQYLVCRLLLEKKKKMSSTNKFT